MEWHQLTGRHADIRAQFGVIQLDGGMWADGIWGGRGFDERLHPTREAALRRAAAVVIRETRKMARSRDTGWRALPGQASGIIAWALGEAGRPPRRLFVRATPGSAPKPTAKPAPTWSELPLFAQGGLS
jgi:hypothetical protein